MGAAGAVSGALGGGLGSSLFGALSGSADGGTASSPLPGLSKDDYGADAGLFDRFGLS